MNQLRFFFFLAFFFLGGCANKVTTHGWVGDFKVFDEIEVKKTTKEEAKEKLGLVPVTSMFSRKRYGQDVLYYLRRQTLEKTTLFYPRTIYFQGRLLWFNKAGILLKKEAITQKDWVTVKPSLVQEPFYGDVPSIWSVFVRNFARSSTKPRG